MCRVNKNMYEFIIFTNTKDNKKKQDKNKTKQDKARQHNKNIKKQ